jgi:hypothetical protein
MIAHGRPVQRWLSLLALMLGLSSAAQAFDHRHAAWTALLSQHVHWNESGSASSVDYAGFARQRAALGGYLDGLAGVSEAQFQEWSPAQRQAFLINAYNAHTVALILTAHPGIESIKELGSWFRSPWKRPVATLLGKQRSLDDIEHGLLRGAPDFAEPRIHFAVNCASIGCPALRHEAFVAEQLDQQLEDQTQRFLADRTRNRLRDEAPVLAEVSAIFDWYAADFGGSAGVGRFLARHADSLAASAAQTNALREGRFKLRALDYDWALNEHPP